MYQKWYHCIKYYKLLQYIQAIEKGDPEGAFASWLESLSVSGDEKKTVINTIRYNNSSTALHLAAEYNCPKIAKLLLDKGAGIPVMEINVHDDCVSQKCYVLYKLTW